MMATPTNWVRTASGRRCISAVPPPGARRTWQTTPSSGPAVPAGLSSAIHAHLSDSELRPSVVDRARLEIRHRSLARRPGLCALGEHGSELLDPRPSIRHPAL